MGFLPNCQPVLLLAAYWDSQVRQVASEAAAARRAMNQTPKACLAALLLILAGNAGADIYGYVDEKGVAHLSNVPLHDGYYLFKKEPPDTLPPDWDPATAVLPNTGLAPVPYYNSVQRRQYAPLVTAVAKEHGLDEALLHAVITVECGYNPRARSPKGAMGLMQLMPETAQRYAIKNVWDPRENLRGGARYLRDLLAMFNNNLSLALAAYNAGEAAVIRAGHNIPPFAETLSYVPRVLGHYERYRLLGKQ